MQHDDLLRGLEPLIHLEVGPSNLPRRQASYSQEFPPTEDRAPSRHSSVSATLPCPSEGTSALGGWTVMGLVLCDAVGQREDIASLFTLASCQSFPLNFPRTTVYLRCVTQVLKE